MSEHALLEYVINSIWQVPMLAILAWLLIWLGKPGAQTQHRIWLMTLVLSILLPLLGSREFPARPSLAKLGTLSAAMRPAQVAKTAEDSETAGSHAFATHNDTPQTPWERVRTLRLSQSAVDWLLGLYLTILMLRLIQLAFAWRAARSLVTHARSFELQPSERTVLENYCEKFHVQEPRMLISSQIASPMTIGGIRPAVLLPEAFAENMEGEIAAVLCHELAHVQRRDYVLNWICQLGALPIAYHPATHGLQRRIRQTRELVCDAMAAGAMRSTTEYARCLVTLAQRMLDGKNLAQQVQAAGLFDHDVLEERVMRLLEKKNRISVRAMALRTTGAIALTVAMVAAAGIFHLTPTVVKAAETNARVVLPAGNPVRSTDETTAQQAAPAQPPAPTPNAAEVPPVTTPAPGDNTHAKGVQSHVATGQNDPLDLTPEQRARVEQDMAADNARILAETKSIQNPEFQKQMANMQLQIAEATKKLQSAAVQRQMQRLQSPEFKKQMADMQQQIAEATSRLKSAEVQKQMEALQSPEFQKQMADMQRQIAEATKKIESSEVQQQMRMLQSQQFKEKMADMQREIEKVIIP